MLCVPIAGNLLLRSITFTFFDDHEGFRQTYLPQPVDLEAHGRLGVEVLASTNLLEQIPIEDEDSNNEDYSEKSKIEKVAEKANERAT